MDAQIITIGTELLLGQIIDTNSAFIARKLAGEGINLYHTRSVGDNKKRLKEVLRRAKKEADVILSTGGMGPTSDDITVETIGEVLGKNLTLNEKAMDHLKTYLSELGSEMSPSNKKQARLPEGSKTIPNPRGTALGVILEGEESIIIAMPGVSEEMKPMVKDHVIPYLKDKLPEEERKTVIRSRRLRTCGIGESALQEKVSDFLNQKRPTVAPLAKLGEVHLRITAKGRPEEVEKLISSTESKLQNRLGKLIYAKGEKTLQRRVVEMLKEKGLKLSLAESSSGGIITRKIYGTEKGREVLDRGLTLSSEKSKNDLLKFYSGPPDNEEIRPRKKAKKLASALKELTGTDLSLATSDLFPKDKNSKEGNITFFSLAESGEIFVEKFPTAGSRVETRERIAKGGLTMLYEHLTNYDADK